MIKRRINQALWGLAATCGAAAAAVLVAGWMMPLRPDGTSSADRDSAAPATSSAPLPQLTAHEPLWSMRLQGDIGASAGSPPEQARPASEPAAPAPAGVPVTLVGTIGQSLAMLRDSDGAIEVRGVGETVAGVEVLEVRPARVQVRYNGEVITLHKPADVEGGF